MPDYLEYHLQKKNTPPVNKEDEQKFIPEETVQGLFDESIDRMTDLYGKEYAENKLLKISHEVNTLLDDVVVHLDTLIETYNELSRELDTKSASFDQLKELDRKITGEKKRLEREEKEINKEYIQNEIEKLNERIQRLRTGILNMDTDGHKLLEKYDFLQKLKARIYTIRSLVSPIDPTEN